MPGSSSHPSSSSSPARMLLVVLGLLTCVWLAHAQSPTTEAFVYVKKGETAEFPCHSYDPKAKLQWRGGSRHLPTSSRMDTHQVTDPNLLLLSISNAQMSDAGNFTCTDGTGLSVTELVVLDYGPPRNVQGDMKSRDEIMVTWLPPSSGHLGIESYRLHVTEVTDAPRPVSFTKKANSDDTPEQFLLEDLKPGATYDIEIAPLYMDGLESEVKAVDGPKSQKVRVMTPNFDSPPSKVKAMPHQNSTILVTWQPPPNIDERSIDGYMVEYKSTSRRKNAPSGEVKVSQKAPSGRWEAILRDLPIRHRYKIMVSAVNRDQSAGKKSPPVTVRHDGFSPEMSIKAMAVGPDTVLLTLNTVGVKGPVTKLRVFYSDDTATKWNRVKRFDSNENTAVITGLQPRSTYFFMAKAKIDKKTRQVVTHATTLPSGLQSPVDLNVVPNTEDSVEATWNYNGSPLPEGYILYLDARNNDTDTFRPFKVKAVFGGKRTIMDGLSQLPQYRAKVVPVNKDGVGPDAEVFFRLAATDEVTTTTSAPRKKPLRFLKTPERRMEINQGERIQVTCIADGLPRPDIQWYKNGRPIGASSQSTNVIALPNLMTSFILECKAKNDFQEITSTTRVTVTRGIAQEMAPEILPIPKVIETQQGQRLSLVCQATGDPRPLTSWFKDGAVVRSNSGLYGPNEYVEESLTKSFKLMCRAWNSQGHIHASTDVIVKPNALTGSQPILAKPLPRSITKQESEDLTLECLFDGEPKPRVQWYTDNQPLSPSSTGRSILFMPSLRRSTTLTCKGENSYGVTEESVQLIVRPREGTTEPLAVTLRTTPISPSDVEVKWKIDAGNVNTIRGFRVYVKTEGGRSLFRDTMESNQRSILLTSLSSGIRYLVKLETISPSNMITSETSFVPRDLYGRTPAIPHPALIMEVIEIREDSVRLSLSLNKIDSEDIHSYRVRVLDMQVTQGGREVLNTNLTPSSNSLAVRNLIPNRQYMAVVEAFRKDRSGQPLAVNATFISASAGGRGNDITVVSPDLYSRTRAPILTTSTPRYEMTTTMTLTVPTTTLTTSTTTRRVTTTSPPTQPPQPQSSDYVMDLDTANMTPYLMDIRWSIDRGDVDKVASLLISIKHPSGRELLRQTLLKDQRSITISPLEPSSGYKIKVSALGAGGPSDVLVYKEIDVYTLSPNARVDTSNPFLDFEAREIRSSGLRFFWSTVNANESHVASYQIRVFDRDANGANLLTENMPAASQSLHLTRLPANKRYYVTLDAKGPNGRTLLSSSLTFETAPKGQYGIPVRGSSGSTPRDLVQPVSPVRRSTLRPPRSTLRPTIPDKPVVTMEIRQHQDPGTVRLTWTLVAPDPRLIYGYRVEVFSGSRGNKLLMKDLTLNTAYFDVMGLQHEKSYVIKLHALDRRGQPVVTASTSYRLPPPGMRANPFSVSSEPTTLPPPSSDTELVILGVTPAGRGAVKLSFLTLEDRIPTQPVMIRYAPFANGVRGSYRIESAAGSHQEAVVTGLTPGQIYGFQVAVAPSGSGQFVRWSKMVRRQATN